MGETKEQVAAKAGDSAPSLTPDSPPVDTAKAALGASAGSPNSTAGSSDNRASSEESAAAAEESTSAAGKEGPMAAGGEARPTGGEGGKDGVETVDLETDSDATSEDEAVASQKRDGERAWGTEGESFSVWESAIAALEAAEESRKLGNDAFSQGKFFEAKSRYTEACAFLNSTPVLSEGAQEYEDKKQECIEKSKLNIAACCIKLDDHMGCIGACQEILNVNSGCVKALYRIGVAYMNLKAFASARASLYKAGVLAPNDPLIRASLKECISKDATFDAEFAKKIFSKTPGSAESSKTPGGSADSSPSKPGAAGGEHDTEADDSREWSDQTPLSEDDETDEEEEEDDHEDTDDDSVKWADGGAYHKNSDDDVSDEDEDDEDDDDEEDEDEDEDEEDDETAPKTFPWSSPGEKKSEGVFRFTGAGARGESDIDRLGRAEEVLSQMERAALLEELESERMAAMAALDSHRRSMPGEGGMRRSMHADSESLSSVGRSGPAESAAATAGRSAALEALSASRKARAAAEMAAEQSARREAARSKAMASPSPTESAADECKARGNDHFKSGDFFPAIREYTQAVNLSRLQSFTKHAQAAIYLSNRSACYIKIEMFQEAVDDCEAALEIDPTFWKASFRGGQAAQKMGQFDKAIKLFEQAEAVSGQTFPETSKARQLNDEVKSVHQLIATDQAERALSCIKSIVNETPNSFALRLLHCKVLEACKRFQEVLPVLQTLRLEHGLADVHQTELHHMAARALTGLARIPEALSKYKELLRLDPDNHAVAADWRKVKAISTKINEGADAIMVRNYSKARDAYGEAMEVDTGNDCLVALMLSNRAATFQKQREEAMECEVLLSKAEKECEEAQEALLLAQRRLIKGHETLQLYQRRDARIRKEFIEDEEKALLDPGVDPSPPHLLGPDGKPNSVCRGRWALCKAIEDACAALDRDPNCAPALVHRSRSYKEVGDLTEAVSDMERALNSTDRLVGHEGMEPAVLRSELREAQRQLTAAPIDHYKVLGLGGGGPTITADAIKKAYRRMAIKYHPDKQAHLGGEERGRMERRFKQISEANQVLGDATERRLFDMRRARRGATFPRYGGGSSYSRGFGNSNRSPYDDDDDDLSGF